MGEAPDIREQGDCPSADACDGRCDQHSLSADLEAATIDALLTTFAALTHRIHVAKAEKRKATERDLRVQRDMVRDEIKRRTGDLE